MRFNMLPSTSRSLSDAEIMESAPAVFADRPADHVSPNYHFVNTGEIVRTLRNEGWNIASAHQQNVRMPDKALGTKHMLTVVRPNQIELGANLGGLTPALYLTNSHDWSSRLIMSMGFIRKICSNGLIGFSGEFGKFTIRHDHVPEDLNTVLSRFGSLVNMMLEKAERLSNVVLSPDQRFDFARKAADIRFGESADADKANALLRVHRSADNGPTLWQTYNVVQENAIKGCAKYGMMERRVRALSNIDALQSINTDLLTLAEQYATV